MTYIRYPARLDGRCSATHWICSVQMPFTFIRYPVTIYEEQISVVTELPVQLPARVQQLPC